MDTPLDVWIRNDRGQIFGPLNAASIELMLDSGVIAGRVQVSLDGEHYVFPGRLPGIRMVFPKALWGEAIAEEGEADRSFARVLLPPPLETGNAVAQRPSQISARVASSPSGLVAGPGATANAKQRSAYPMQSRPSAATPEPAVEPQPVLEAEVLPLLDDEAMLLEPEAVEVAASAAPAQVLSAQMSPLEANPEAIEDDTVLRRYVVIAVQQLTGTLQINLAHKTLSLRFRKGTPEAVSSSHPADSVASFLMQQRLVTGEQVKAAEAQKAAFQNDLITALFGLKILEPSKAFSVLVEHSKALLYEGLSQQTGQLTWTTESASAGGAVPLGDKWAAYFDFVRRLPMAEVRKRMQPLLTRPVLKSGGRVDIAILKLSPIELRTMALFDGIHSLAALQQLFPNEGDALLRTALLLHPLELVSFDSSRASAPVSAPQAASHSAAPSSASKVASSLKPPVISSASTAGLKSGPSSPAAGKSTSPSAVQSKSAVTASASSARSVSASTIASVALDDVKSLNSLFAKMKGQNHFEVLGVIRSVDSSALRMAYLKMARLYHPDTVLAGTAEAIANAKASIFTRVNEANRVLSDAGLRAEYENELNHGGTGEKVDVSKIFEAEECFQKGMILVKARKFAEAVKMLDAAIAAHDEEVEYFAWRGFAKFFGHTDKKVGQVAALADIDKCLTGNARVSSAWYFKGFILKANGDLVQAKTCFKKCADLDPRHVDAARELRLLVNVK